ncbi:MAG: aminotransferase class I/II-fold pyridoxal phosphate-dependent enzyme [Acidovorax sp.]|nr:aminotransferase class I/II-fold pyridoxal phosphate-dependent enzyme [Acidovorax sp.]
MTSLYVQGSGAAEIADSLAAQLQAGALQPGDALPAVRALAQQLGVNPNTVAAAYARLRDAGRVVTDGRRGTRVAGLAPPLAQAPALPEGLRDLASGNVDAALLPVPRADWWTALHSGAGYDGPAEVPAWQNEAAAWLASQGLPGGAVATFSGTLDAVERALRLHARPGDRVGVEDPGWPPLVALLHSLRLRPVPLPIDAQGLCVPAPEVLGACAALVLTPRAHNPTGVALGAARWKALRKALQRHPQLLVVFDDHWGPLSAAPLAFSGATGSLPPLWLYVASVGKFLGPDLRLALAAGPASLIEPLRAQQAVGPRWVSRLLQGLAARLWRGAREDGTLERARATYAARRAALQLVLRAEGVDCPPGGEGLHLWLPVADEAAVVTALAARGWAAQAGAPFRLASAPAVRISLGALREGDMPRLARDLAQALAPAPGRAVF